MHNLVTQDLINENFIVNKETGAISISQRKCAQLLGVDKRAISHQLATKFNNAPPITEEIFFSMVKHFAMVSKAKNKKSAHVLEYIISCKNFTLNELESDKFKNHMLKFNANSKKANIDKSGYIYLVKCEDFYKIGKTNTDDAGNRVTSMQTGNPYDITIELVIKVNNAFASEAYLHNKFSDYHHRGEWFKFDLDTKDEVLKEMKLMCM